MELALSPPHFSCLHPPGNHTSHDQHASCDTGLLDQCFKSEMAVNSDAAVAGISSNETGIFLAIKYVASYVAP